MFGLAGHAVLALRTAHYLHLAVVVETHCETVKELSQTFELFYFLAVFEEAHAAPLVQFLGFGHFEWRADVHADANHVTHSISGG